ncbi:hypothetical protein JTB14_004976 [Gonioctena quinquepunctata]|nr:hypothetical protein JTB14_004976 [Gonioctena quinquepunctata]
MRTNNTGQKEPLLCPPPVKDYNENMGGVDIFEQYIPFYNISWKSRRCTLANELIGTYSSRQRRTSSTAPVAKLLKKSRKSLNSPTTMRRADVGLHLPVKGTIRRCAYCSSKAKPVHNHL